MRNNRRDAGRRADGAGSREAGVAAPVARGETQLIVRTVTAGAPGQELVGAACVADTPWFQAKFTSPARILMPDLGASAPTVTVTCRSGTATGTAAAPPVAAWSEGWAAGRR